MKQVILRAELRAQQDRARSFRWNLISCVLLFAVSLSMMWCGDTEYIRPFGFVLLVGVLFTAHLLRQEYKADRLDTDARIARLREDIQTESSPSEGE